MELLILGIDGGDERIIRGMDMPFLKGLLDKSSSRQLTEDIYSRGWAEIMTGVEGPDNGAIYMAPELDGTYKFTFKYGMSDMAGKSYIKTLPDMLAGNGKSLGMMNVPTTGPACSVNGFMVAGGGGGVNKIEGIPDSLCYPVEAKQTLEEFGYVPDLRLKTSGILAFSELMDQLDAIVRNRADSYLKLVDQYKPDVGFLCFRVTTDIQYLAMSEIESILSILEMPEMPENDTFEGLDAVQARIVAHYRVLDEAIEKVFSAIKPVEHIITSDHGASRYLHNINFDQLLQEKGYQYSIEQSLIKKVLRGFWRKFIPRGVVRTVRDSAGTGLARAVNRFDPKKTVAFGNYYSRGIYINDQKRFGGPIKTSEVDSIVDELCVAVNNDERSQEIGLVVAPYRRKYMDKRFSDILADIVIEAPDTNFVMGEGAFISRNSGYGPLSEDLSSIESDMHSGQKGHQPLCFFSDGLSDLVSDEDANNLTFIYHLIRKYSEK